VKLIDQLLGLFLEDSILKDQHALVATFTSLNRFHSTVLLSELQSQEIGLIFILSAFSILSLLCIASAIVSRPGVSQALIFLQLFIGSFIH
jgi:hypothetical protein